MTRRAAPLFIFGLVLPVLLGFGGPVLPPSWTVSAWYIDPANSIACASDSNSGTSATCSGGCSGSTCPSGVGPLRTFQELDVHRWGCIGNPTSCPRLRQDTVVTFLSSHVDNSDPVYFYPAIEAGAHVRIQGQLPAPVVSGTLSGVTVANRSTPTLTLATLGAGAATGQLLVNSTHPARAWVYASAGGSSWKLSQPLVPVTLPTTSLTPAEVNTFANGDSYALYSPVAVNIVSVVPTLTDVAPGFDNSLAIYQLQFYDPLAPGDDTVSLGENVRTYESYAQRLVGIIPTPGAELIHACINVWTNGAYNSAAGDTDTTQYTGGVIAAFPVFGTIALDGDVIIGAGGFAAINGGNLQTNYYGPVYIDTGATLAFGAVETPYSGYGAGNVIVWGPGTLNVQGTGRLAYAAGAGQAAATFKQSGGFQADSQTKVCLGVQGAASAFGTCNITLSAASLDSNLGATSGCLAVPGGASVCNYGP